MNDARLVLMFIIAFLSVVSMGQDVPKDKQNFFFYYNKKDNSWWSNLVQSKEYLVGRSFALVAGIYAYPNMGGLACGGQGGSLPPVKIDLYKLKYYLKEVEKFDEIVVIENEDVTYENLAYFFQNYFPDHLRGLKNTRFLFAYSGHGMKDSEGDSYILKASAKDCMDKGESIKIDALYSLVQEVVKVSHHTLVLLNSCYGGGFLHFGGGIRTPIPKYAGAHAITAGSDGELVVAQGPNTGSIFFESVFSGLNGRAKQEPGDPIITAEHLYAYLIDQIRSETNQLQNPKKGDIYPKGSRGEFFFIDRSNIEESLPKSTILNWKWLKFGEPDSVQTISSSIGAEATASFPKQTIDTTLFKSNREISLAEYRNSQIRLLLRNKEAEIKYTISSEKIALKIQEILDVYNVKITMQKVYDIQGELENTILFSSFNMDAAMLMTDLVQNVVTLGHRKFSNESQKNIRIILAN
jgi:hypothetical protein